MPEHAGFGGLGSAGAEELDASEPDGGDAVVLVAGGGHGEGKHDAGPRGGAVRSGRGVWDGSRGQAVGVGEGVVEDELGAGRGGWEQGRGECGVHVFLGLLGFEALDDETVVGEQRRHRRGGRKRGEDEEEREHDGGGGDGVSCGWGR